MVRTYHKDRRGVRLKLFTPESIQPITGKQIKDIPKYGLYLVSPHGKYIYTGQKTLVVKTRKYSEHINEELYLYEDGLCYGVVVLGEPKKLSLEEFWNRKDEHKISKEEFNRWNWKGKELYGYKVGMVHKFKPPVPVKVPKGVQVFVSTKNVKFLKVKEMSLEDLVYYHALTHSNNPELFSPFCSLHYRIAVELVNRGEIHPYLSSCDRAVEWLFMDIHKYDPTKVSKQQLADDFRLALGHYSNLKQGKKYKGWKPEDMVWFIAHKLLPEMIKRGFTFNKPETYTKYAAECFRKAIKEYGKKIPWKEEQSFTLPEHMNIEDIDVKYVQGLNDKELIELWKYLVDTAEERGRVTEDVQNAGIFTGIEMAKRGLWDRYSGDNILADEVRLEVTEYPLPRGLSSSEEPTEITLEKVLKTFQEAGPIVVKGQPFACYVAGRIVNEGKIPKDHDIDLIFRQHPDPRIIRAIRNKEPAWLFKRIHVVFDPTGPLIGYSVPTHGYALNPLPKEIMVKGYGPFRELALKVGKPFVGLKPKSGFDKHEFWDTSESWKKYGIDHIQNGILVQEKVDGRRMQCHIYDNKVKIITEDRQRDRASQFPNIVEELRKLGVKDAILDGEMLVFDIPPNMLVKNARFKRDHFELVPREDTAAITTGKVSKELEDRIVYVFYDILFLNGEDLSTKSALERYNILKKLIPKNSRYLDVVKSELVHSMKEYFKAVHKMRRENGSEGAVLKDAKSTYPIKYSGENRTDEWCKIKNLKEIDVIVWKIVEKKKKTTGEGLGNYMYWCAFSVPSNKMKKIRESDIVTVKGKKYVNIGRSYATDEKVNIGDIITVMPIRVRKFETRDGKIYYTWMFPLYKEKKPEKTEPDSITTVERLVKVGTKPVSLSEDNIEHIVINLEKCPYYKDENVCPLKHKFVSPRDELSYTLEVERLKYPINCPLAWYFKCRYLKPYYYEISTVELDELVGELVSNLEEVPDGEIELCEELAWMSSYPKKDEGRFVIQRHEIGDSQHGDNRFEWNDHLEGASIVGFSKTSPFTIEKLKSGRNFRAEPKAKQPKVWLKVEGEVKPGQVGAGKEKAGKFTILASGKYHVGAIKPWFKEFFLYDPKHGLNWTRLVYRLVRLPKIDPDTKEPVPGQKELTWIVRVPKDQTPYTVKRGMKEGWKPPRGKIPIPPNWIKEHKEEYEKWLQWVKGKEESLSSMRYTLSMHKYRGPFHIRGTWRIDYYLFLDEKGKGDVRVYHLTGHPFFDNNFSAWDEGYEDRKYLTFEGATQPRSRFNPNKKLKGEMSIIAKGTVEYNEEEENGKKVITLKFKSGIPGTWRMKQETKGSLNYSFKKISSESLQEGTFVLDVHEFPENSGKIHYDLRIDTGKDYILEFNLYGNPLEKGVEEPVVAVKKECYDKEWMKVKPKGTRMKAFGKWSTVETIDHGKINVINNTSTFVSMDIKGEKLKGYYIAKRVNHTFEFMKSRLPKPLSVGDPSKGTPYDPFVIEEKKGWDHFNVYLYDMKQFTRCEPQDLVKEYLKKWNITLPEGVTASVCLYPVEGTFHHARIGALRFKKDKWDYDKAVSFITSNKLWEKESVQIRGKKEEESLGECPLCKREKLTKWYYEDEIVWVADCKSHPDKKLIVLKRHTSTPTKQELEHMKKIASELFPNKEWRGPRSIPEHFHLHEI